MNIKNSLEVAATLAVEFSTTAIEQSDASGTPKYERDRIRESGLLKIVISKGYGGWELPW